MSPTTPLTSFYSKLVRLKVDKYSKEPGVYFSFYSKLVRLKGGSAVANGLQGQRFYSKLVRLKGERTAGYIGV